MNENRSLPGFNKVLSKDYEAFITGIVMTFLVIIALLLLQPAFLIIGGPMILWMAVMMLYRVSVVRKIFKNGEVVTGSVIKVGKPKGRLMMAPIRELNSKSLKGTYVILFSFECNGKNFQHSTRIRFRPGMIEAKHGDKIELIVLTPKPKHFVIREVWDEKAEL